MTDRPREIDHDEALVLLDGARGATVASAEAGEDRGLLLRFEPRLDGTPSALALQIEGSGWRLEDAARVLVSDHDPVEVMARVPTLLEGRDLTSVEVERPSLSTTFSFGGLVVKTFTLYTTDYDAWTLRLSNNHVLAASPGGRWTCTPRA